MIRCAFIGVDRHVDPGIRDLNGAARDATALSAVLSDSIDNLTPVLITDQAATLSAVRATLDATLGAAEEDDVVLLSFAGHGTRDHRLVMTDTRMDDLPATTLDMAELAERFRTTRARAVLLLLDCCFSGGAPARVLDAGLATRSIGTPLNEIAGRGRILFAASRPDEEALEDPQTRHGLFTKAFIDCLVAANQPVSVIGLVDQIVQLVRAGASRLGYEQVPVILGHVEGELMLPAGRRGQSYYAAFPERAPITTRGAFPELAHYGIPHNVLQAWQERFPSGLNALQLAAVNEHGVLAGQSLLTVAPTSAGKTFIGELAALKAIAEGRKAVFLLPYKALVNEKYEDFAAIYGERLNLRIARCSGDWQDQVGDVMRGKYDIAFFTYEKFLGMCVAAPHLLHQIGLVVVDEAQFITDPGRGMVVELLLTALVSARKRGVSPQLIALSAVIGETNQFERWLDCGLLMTEQRPVPLTEGVLDRSGMLSTISPSDEIRHEEFLDPYSIRQRGEKPSSQDVVVPLVRQLVEKGEKVIVFRNARGPSAGCAQYLADELGLPPAQSVLDALPENDLSDMSQRLRRALAGGVAFHHGDLNRDERIAVERGFRSADGGVQVLVATSTVAAGVNTPASTVVIVETSFRGAGQPQPYTVAQYKNMAGRAGRLGYESNGKAITIASTGFERDTLFHRYAQGRPEPITSSFDDSEPGTWVMRLLAQVQDVRREDVVDLVANTYGGFLAALRDSGWRAAMTRRIEGLLDRMLADGLLELVGEKLRLTMLGRACGESPLSLDSAMQAVELVRRFAADVPLEKVLAIVEALPERDEDYTPQNRNGEPARQTEAARRLGPDVARALRSRARSDKEYYARCKRAMIVRDWIDGAPISEIEARYSSNPFVRVAHGDIRGFADGTRFLFDSVLRIAALVLETAFDADETDRLLTRLDLGIPDQALALSRIRFALTRGDILEFLRNGLVSAEAIAAADDQIVERVVGQRAVALLAVVRPAQAA